MKTAYINGKVYTGDLDLQQAFIVENGKFGLVGANEDVLAQSPDAVVDLEGGFVCPGFNDSHMHVLNYGRALTIAPLHEHTSSLEDMIDCLRSTRPGPGGWILGRGWNQDMFSDVHRMPDRHDLDRVSTEHPVCATRACGHVLSVNTRALERLGITADTPVPGGGKLVVEDGRPNGIFYDDTMDMVSNAMPAPDVEDVKNMIRAACRAMNKNGITSCHTDDYGVFKNLPWQVVNQAYRELEAAGELTVRITQQANFTRLEDLAEFIAAGNVTGAGSDFFRIGPLKMLGDGALGAHTAYLSRPYADKPDTCGLGVFTAEEFDALIGYAHAHGMQVAIHAIGDACLDLVLNSVEKALAEHPRADHRHGIVHCQITRPDQLERIAKNHMHVYAQSIFLDYDLHIVEKRVGPELAASSYNWKTLMDMGATVSNGSDCPVELPVPLSGIQCAVTRRDLSGAGPYLPHEAFSVKEAFDSFTIAGAYASFEENVKGRIAPGMLADFVVLAQSPFDVDPSTIKDIPITRLSRAG